MAKPVLDDLRFHSEPSAFAYVEAILWPDGPVCPTCPEGGAAYRLNGQSTRLGLHKCRKCKRQFTVRNGTILESSHLPLHLWLQVIHLMAASKKGISTRQIQRLLRCSMKTAWFVGHRVREAMKSGPDAGQLGGDGMILEADETFVGATAGKKKNRKPVPKQVVFSLVERDGKVRSVHLPNVRAHNLGLALAEHANTKSVLFTDERPAYVGFGWNFRGHGYVNHSRNQYAFGPVNTNTIEGYFSILKRGLYGVYQHVSNVHLGRYLSEFDFRYSNREAVGIDDVSRANIAIQGMKGKRLTYETTVQ